MIKDKKKKIKHMDTKFWIEGVEILGRAVIEGLRLWNKRVFGVFKE